MASATAADQFAFTQYNLPANSPAEGVVLPGATFVARIEIQNQADLPVSTEFTVRLLDFWETTRKEQKLKVEFKPKEKKECDISFTAPELGIFKIRVVVPDQGLDVGTTKTYDLASFACLPKIEKKGVDSFYGWHFRQSSDGELALAERLGVSWNRTFMLFSNGLQAATKGVEQNRTHGISLLGQLFPPGQKGPVTEVDNDAFAKHVREMVSNCKEIKFWELFNEPDHPHFFKLSNARYAELVKIAHGAMKQANPEAELMLSAFTMDPKLFDQRMAMLSQDDCIRYAGALSIHYYIFPEVPTSRIFRDIRKSVDAFNDLTKKKLGRELPIWNTEGGPQGWVTSFYAYDGLEKMYPGLAKFVDDFGKDGTGKRRWYHVESAHIVKMDMVERAVGMKKNFAYLQDWDYPRFGKQWNPWKSFCWQEITRSMRPVMVARFISMIETDGLRLSGYIEDNDRQWFAFVFDKGNGQSLAVCYAEQQTGVSVRTSIDNQITSVHNIMGNPVGTAVDIPLNEVVYVQANLPADDMLAALRSATLTPIPLRPNDVPAVSPPKKADDTPAPGKIYGQ